MKQKRFKESQIIEFLREGENPDIGVKGVCRRRGISEPTFYRWKKIYGGIDESYVFTGGGAFQACLSDKS